jgi:hypothetical protein
MSTAKRVWYFTVIGKFRATNRLKLAEKAFVGFPSQFLRFNAFDDLFTTGLGQIWVPKSTGRPDLFNASIAGI